MQGRALIVTRLSTISVVVHEIEWMIDAGPVTSQSRKIDTCRLIVVLNNSHWQDYEQPGLDYSCTCDHGIIELSIRLKACFKLSTE